MRKIDKHLDQSIISSSMQHFFGAIEAGGTKFICAIGNDHGNIITQAKIETTTPDKTMPQVIDFFHSMQKQYPLQAIGCGSFGPIDPNKLSSTYGYITHTPKLAWQHYNIVKTLNTQLKLTIGFDTDVNAALLGEYHWGAAQGLSDCIYLTIGTGIGGGAIINHQLYHGSSHPEMGHIFIPPHLHKDHFAGICPYHQHCLEGLASGSALKARWQVNSAVELPAEHPAWDLQAEYLAYAAHNFMMSFMPQKIILGGGVMKQTHLFNKIHQKLKQITNGYLSQQHINTIDQIIVPVGLANNAGVMGAIALAKTAAQHKATNHEHQ